MTVIIVVFTLLLPVVSLAGIIKLEPLVTDLENPVAITAVGDGSNRLFINLQEGQIVIYDGTQLLPIPFLDIRSLVSCCSERGLLGLAFHPDYINNGFFYINYTNTNGNTVVARYTVSDDPNVADPSSAIILLTVLQLFTNHNGGQLQFGPDGYLYIGMGDGGGGGDPQNNAQNLGTLLIDVDSGLPFTIPPDNPFVGNPGARDEIWALGLRNPWRFSFDRLTGDLFIADVGQNDWEELNVQSASSTGGENYGWRLMEGNHCFNPPTNCNDGTLTMPVLEYNHSLGCSITGGFRYRGTEIQQLHGTYLYGDYCSGRIWGAKNDDSTVWSTEELLNTNLSISAFGEDESGEIYLAHYSSVKGAVYRISVVNPVPDIDVNGSDGSVTITPTDTLSVTIALDPGSHVGENADWWLIILYQPPSGSWEYLTHSTFQSPLFDLPPTEILNTTELPSGYSFAFFWGVDMLPDGLINDPLYIDLVIVNVQ
jgi:glucose/arabinose dehydrogenase